MKNLVTLLVLGLVMFNCSPEPIDDGSSRFEHLNDCYVVTSVHYSSDVLKDITVLKYTDWVAGNTGDFRLKSKIPVTNPDIIKVSLGQKICDINILKKIIK